jgi:hypothetical protein
MLICESHAVGKKNYTHHRELDNISHIQLLHDLKQDIVGQ